jgi:hypothetical protein
MIKPRIIVTGATGNACGAWTGEGSYHRNSRGQWLEF